MATTVDRDEVDLVLAKVAMMGMVATFYEVEREGKEAGEQAESSENDHGLGQGSSVKEFK